MKFKVLELDNYCDFTHDFWVMGKKDELNEEECYQFELKQLAKARKKAKRRGITDSHYWDYDGPLRYLEECEDPGFPIRKGIKYCVNETIYRNDGKIYPNSSRYYRPYVCFTYQVGRWWKLKDVQYIFTELHIPQIVTQYDAERLKCPLRFLSNKAKLDVIWYNRQHELRHIYRESMKWSMSILRKIKN